MPDVTRCSSASRQSAPLSSTTMSALPPTPPTLIVTSPFSTGVMPPVQQGQPRATTEKPKPTPLLIPLPGAPTESSTGTKCDGCNEMFADATKVAEHKPKCSTIAYKHVCEECGKRFKSQTALKSHSEWHANKKALTCKECHKVCKNTLLLKLHVEMHASGKFRFRCDSCSKSFLTKKKLEQHVKDHIKEKNNKKRHPKFKHLTPQEMMVLTPSDVAESAYHTSATPVVSGENILPRLATPENLSNHNAQAMSPDVEVVEANEPSTCLMCNETFVDEVKKLMHLGRHFKKSSTDDTKYICQVIPITLFGLI